MRWSIKLLRAFQHVLGVEMISSAQGIMTPVISG